MDRQLEKSHGILFWYMITIWGVLYAQKWKHFEIPTIGESLVKITELAKTTKLICFIRDRSTTTFIGNPLWIFCWKREREMNLWFMSLTIRKSILARRKLWCDLRERVYNINAVKKIGSYFFTIFPFFPFPLFSFCFFNESYFF